MDHHRGDGLPEVRALLVFHHVGPDDLRPHGDGHHPDDEEADEHRLHRLPDAHPNPQCVEEDVPGEGEEEEAHPVDHHSKGEDDWVEAPHLKEHGEGIGVGEVDDEDNQPQGGQKEAPFTAQHPNPPTEIHAEPINVLTIRATPKYPEDKPMTGERRVWMLSRSS